MRILFTTVALCLSFGLYTLQPDYAPPTTVNIPSQTAETIPKIARANSLRGSLLNDHFGVTPTLQQCNGGDGTHAFIWSSLTPTLNIETATHVNAIF